MVNLMTIASYFDVPQATHDGQLADACLIVTPKNFDAWIKV